MTYTVHGTGFEMRRRYRASRQRLFKAFSDPTDLRAWYAPVAGWVVSRADVDARAGGGYHLEFGPPGGELIVEVGIFREFDPPLRLVIEVQLAGGIAAEATTITVEFTEIGDETEVLIRESGYSSEVIARRHAAGWSTMLEQLVGVVES